jgi:hypothetical protein
MSNVRVYNTNNHPFEQKFRDSIIKIPAGKFIEMDREEAVAFKSQWYPVTLDYNGNVDPKSYKRLTIKPIPTEGHPEPEMPKFINHATGESFDSHEALLADIKSSPELLAAQQAANEDLEVAQNAKKTRAKP